MTLVLSGNTGSALDGIKNSLMFLETAKATTSGTSIDFTGIPSWAKKITVMFNGVSTNGTSIVIVRVGASTVSTTGYFSCVSEIVGGVGVASATSTAGFPLSVNVVATSALTGNLFLYKITANTWTLSHNLYRGDGSLTCIGTGSSPSLSGTLDVIRITTVNGTDTFDAGSINILIEGYV
jgi:hypothetical protein